MSVVLTQILVVNARAYPLLLALGRQVSVTSDECREMMHVHFLSLRAVLEYHR